MAEVKPVSKGAIGGQIYRLDSDPSTLIMAVLFEDKESYHARAEPGAGSGLPEAARAAVGGPDLGRGEVIATF